VSAPAWDTERAAELATQAYGYVARVYPRAAAQLYGEIMDNQRPLRKELAPPAPPEPAGPGRNTVDVMGVVNRGNVYGELYERGTVEAMLSYLAALEGRYVAADDDQGAA
jgi:hypothetical protein